MIVGYYLKNGTTIVGELGSEDNENLELIDALELRVNINPNTMQAEFRMMPLNFPLFKTPHSINIKRNDCLIQLEENNCDWEILSENYKKTAEKMKNPSNLILPKENKPKLIY